LPLGPLALVAFDHQHCGDQDETSHDLPGPVTLVSYGRSATTIAHALKTFEPSSAAKNHRSSLTTTETGYTYEGQLPLIGIMWVIEDHPAASGSHNA
jgi:hypothetical protein